MSTDDPGTMFPPLYDSDRSSGDGMHTQDITNVPLPPLSGTDDEEFLKRTRASMTSTPATGEPLESLPKAEDKPEADSPKKGNRTTARERISELTQKFRTAESENESLRRELSEIRQSIQGLGARRDTPSPREPETFRDDGADIASVVERVVQKHLSPVVDRLNQQDELTRLQREQVASAEQAARLVPQLQDLGSEERELYEELRQNTDLMGRSDGPLIIAHMVRSAMLEDRESRQRDEPRKRAASVVSTGPGDAGTQSAPNPQAKADDLVLQEGFARMRAGQDDANDYVTMRKAQRRRQPRAEFY